MAERELPAVRRITIVDDVITKGSTLLGAASRLAEAYPEARLAAFALVRTKSRQPEVERIDDPCLGKIQRFGDEGERTP